MPLNLVPHLTWWPFILLLLPVPASAHAITGSGFTSGMLHHLLAMLSVGILSAQLGGRAILTVLAAFPGRPGWVNL